MIFKKRNWETDETWSVLPSTDQNLYDSFDAVAEQDFNPDMVILYGHDAYDEGMKNGFVIAVAASAAVGAIYAAGKALYKKVKNRKKVETHTKETPE